ncbi:MAG: hypothetical protein Q7J07_00150 [Pelolinea sp.]|nr:hypothetical protein [Pelolinea sp.]
MERKKSHSFFINIWSSTCNKIILIITLAWYLVKELFLDRFFGGVNAMIDNWLLSHPGIIQTVFSFIFKRISLITSIVVSALLAYIIVRAIIETNKEKQKLKSGTQTLKENPKEESKEILTKSKIAHQIFKFDDKKAKPKTLNRVFAHVEYDDSKIYVLIENRESKIDITCSNITVYEVNPIGEGRTFLELNMHGMFNAWNAMAASILSPLTKVDDVIVPIKRKDKIEVNLFAINSTENRLEFKTLYQREALVPGLYGLLFGFKVYPQKEGYEEFDIYITAKINYRGGSKLELWELRNARTRE